MRRREMSAVVLILLVATAAMAQSSGTNWREYWAERNRARQADMSATGTATTSMRSVDGRVQFPGDGPPPTGPRTEAAALTAEKLARKGKIDAVDWSVSLHYKETPLLEVLDQLADKARGKPWEVSLLVDHRGMWEHGKVRATQAVTLDCDGVSLEEAVKIAVGGRFGYTIRDDGSVLVSYRELLEYVGGMWPPDCRLPTPEAAETRRKLARRGTIDGQRWSVDLDFEDVPLNDLLLRISELAAGKPHEVKILVNSRLIIDVLGGALDTRVTLRARDVSLTQALALALGAELAYVIQSDGTVMIGPRKHLVQNSGAEAARLFTVTFDPNILSLSIGRNSELDSLLRSDDVLGVVAHGLLGVPEGRAADYVQINRVSWNTVAGDSPRRRAITCVVTAMVGGRYGFPEILPAGTEILDAAAEVLEEALKAAYERSLEELKGQQAEFEKQVADGEQLMEPIKAKIADLRKEAEKAGWMFESIEASLKRVRDVEDQVQELEMDVEARKARQAALAERIAAINAEMAEKLKGDAISVELERVVKARQEQLEAIRRMADSGRASRDDLVEAEVKLAEAKARLVERREAVARAAGGDLLTRLNGELAMLAVDRAEAEARFALVTRRLAEARKALQMYREIGALEQELSGHQGRANQSAAELANIKRRLDGAMPPEVKVEATR